MSFVDFVGVQGILVHRSELGEELLDCGRWWDDICLCGAGDTGEFGAKGAAKLLKAGGKIVGGVAGRRRSCEGAGRRSVNVRNSEGEGCIYLVGLKDTLELFRAFSRASRALSWSVGPSSIV